MCVIKDEMPCKNEIVVYLLRCEHRTYVGYSTDLCRRIRAHNSEIAGGAKYTSGRQWKIVAWVGGFATKNEAMSFEWRLKKRTRGVTQRLDRMQKMMRPPLCLHKLCHSD